MPPDRRFLGFDAYQKAIDCLGPGDVVLLYTDGVKDRFSLSDYPDLLHDTAESVSRHRPCNKKSAGSVERNESYRIWAAP